jgi:hypothetical protein
MAEGGQFMEVPVPYGQLIEALEVGLDAAVEVAQDYHHKMKGYRLDEHDRLDQDVAIIATVLALVRGVDAK